MFVHAFLGSSYAPFHFFVRRCCICRREPCRSLPARYPLTWRLRLRTKTVRKTTQIAMPTVIRRRSSRLTGVKPSDSVVDVGPGRTGYYTKIMSRIVGATGKVIMFNPTWVADKFPVAKEGPAILAKAGYANVEGSIQPMAEIKFDTPVDVIFMSQLYHDQIWQKIDVVAMNKAIFDALEPGGVFFVIDHVGPGVKTVEQIDKVAPHRARAREGTGAGGRVQAGSRKRAFEEPRRPAHSQRVRPVDPGQDGPVRLQVREAEVGSPTLLRSRGALTLPDEREPGVAEFGAVRPIERAVRLGDGAGAIAVAYLFADIAQ